MGPQALAAAIAMQLQSPINGHPLVLSEQHVLQRRPYLNARGQSVITVNTGQLNERGFPVYREQAINVNATLRKDEWVRLDETVLTSARERLTIVEDLRAAGLTFNVGGLGAIISEWEKSSEMTDAEVTMDGETQVDQDRQEFGIDGVPIPVIQKPFRIGERVLLASRTRGAALDVTTGVEAGRAVARTSERMVFYGSTLGASNSAGNVYRIYGLATWPGRALMSISDWSDPLVSPEVILREILTMVRVLETQERHYGPFNLYIPGAFAFRFREDFKAFGERTLMERVLAEPAINAVRVSDAIENDEVFMLEPSPTVIDLAIAADLTTIQWASPSGWTNFFQAFAAWAPRLKQDFDGRTGILHATVGT